MKKPLIIAIGVIAILLILGIAKDIVIKISVEKGVEIVTGLKLRIGGFKAGVLNTVVDIRKLVLFNPKGFKDPTMIDMPEIFVKYDLPSIMRGKVRLPEVRIDLREFMVVKNEKGELNLDSLNVVKDQKSGSKTSRPGKAPEIQIDSLRLKIGKVIYKDYTAGKEPRVVEYDVRIDEQYNDITDPNALISLIVVKSLANTAIASLTHFDIQGLSGTISDTLASGQKVVTQAAQTAQAAAKGGAAVVKEAQGVAAKTAEAVSDVFKNPFGSGK